MLVKSRDIFTLSGGACQLQNASLTPRVSLAALSKVESWNQHYYEGPHTILMKGTLAPQLDKNSPSS